MNTNYELKCVIGTREKNMIIKGKTYVGTKKGYNWYMITCEDGVQRTFRANRFDIVKEL